METRIIGLSGRKQSGKNTAAEMLRDIAVERDGSITVGLYSFADKLKAICADLFSIRPECLNGTDGGKNQIQEHLLWENMPGSSLVGPMTARQFMQAFGTGVMRKIYEPIWVSSCLGRIRSDGPDLAIITDVRFPNEVGAIEGAGGEILRLSRRASEDLHSSESALDEYSFTHRINNDSGDLNRLAESLVDFYKTTC